MRNHGREAEARRSIAAEVEHFLYRIKKAAQILRVERERAEQQDQTFPEYKPIKGFAPKSAEVLA